MTDSKDILAALSDPETVHVNMLRGAIARPSVAAIWHIYGGELLADMPDDIRDALEPFATFADTFIDDEGWRNPPMRERIVDWFGPSDFRRAQAAFRLLAKEGE